MQESLERIVPAVIVGFLLAMIFVDYAFGPTGQPDNRGRDDLHRYARFLAHEWITHPELQIPPQGPLRTLLSPEETLALLNLEDRDAFTATAVYAR